MKNFKDFLLNENKDELGQKIGDILNAIHDLKDNAHPMGLRQLNRNAEKIVNQIRRILHSNWSKKEEKTLEVLQKVGVAIMRAMDEKDDIHAIIDAAASEIEQLSGDIGAPINNLGAEDVAPPNKEDNVAPPMKDVVKKHDDKPTEQPPQPMPPMPPMQQ